MKAHCAPCHSSCDAKHLAETLKKKSGETEMENDLNEALDKRSLFNHVPAKL